MIYQSTSIESVISKVIRDTKISDTSTIMELYEVIPEAIGMLQTRFQFHHTWKDLKVYFHKAQLPSGLMYNSAVEYCGHRLPWKHSTRAISSPHPHHHQQDEFGFDNIPVSGPLIPDRDDLTNDFVTNPVTQVNPVDGFNFTGYTITQINHLPWHHEHYYWMEMGYINTSFKDGWVRVHYYEAPKDASGNLLVPDNSNYREAIYYFCRAKLIGMGAFEDRVIGEEKCLSRFDHYGARAIDEIDYPTEDQMETTAANQVRLVPPARYWEDFSGGHGGGMIYG